MDSDLEKKRDERCIPIARQILAEMAVSLFPENVESVDAYDPLLVSILQKSLDADLNVTSEAQYLFQLILGAMSGLNTAVHAVEALPNDDARYRGIARTIVQILSDADVPLTNVTPDEVTENFTGVREKLATLFLEEKLTQLEVRYLVDGIFEAFKTVNNLVSESLTQSTARAEAKVLGIDAMSDLTLGQVNKILVNEITISYTPPTPAPETA